MKYDIISSLNCNDNASQNYYVEQLMDLIGILENVTEEELQEQYGISMKEYLNPTANTIKKVNQRVSESKSGMHR